MSRRAGHWITWHIKRSVILACIIWLWNKKLLEITALIFTLKFIVISLLMKEEAVRCKAVTSKQSDSHKVLSYMFSMNLMWQTFLSYINKGKWQPSKSPETSTHLSVNVFNTMCSWDTIQFELKFGNVGFWWEGVGKPEYLEKNFSGKEWQPTTNSTQMRCQDQEENPGHIGGRQLFLTSAPFLLQEVKETYHLNVRWPFSKSAATSLCSKCKPTLG